MTRQPEQIAIELRGSPHDGKRRMATINLGKRAPATVLEVGGGVHVYAREPGVMSDDLARLVYRWAGEA